MVHVVLHAQVRDDFSDGDFLDNPHWAGDTSKWEVIGERLHAVNVEQNTSFYLSTNSNLCQSTEWRFSLDLQFNTSSLNYVDIFLTSDVSDLKSAKNGYFVRVGGTKDEICLYQLKAGQILLLVDGQDGTTNKSTNTLSIQVTCDETFTWELKRSFNSTFQSLQSEGTAINPSGAQYSYFGLRVTQSTSSFSGKHFFDQVSVTKLTKDTIGPVLLQLKVETATKIKLEFSEELANNLADTGLFQLTNSLSQVLPIDLITQDSLLPSCYHVFLKTELEGDYYLHYYSLVDQYGNTNKDAKPFHFNFAKPVLAPYKSILISELFADPSPSNGLPEAEYIELYNSSDKSFELLDYIIGDQSATTSFPPYDFIPHTYLILCQKEDSASFSAWGAVLALGNLPSLNNSEDQITLRNPKNVIVDQVAYTSDWYGNTQKENGGYSLELIDPTSICRRKDNWTSSENIQGGTPGNQNSVWAIRQDTVPPFVTQTTFVSNSSLLIQFSEPLDSNCLLTSNFQLSFNQQILNVHWQKDSLDLITLFLDGAVPTKQEHEIVIKNLRDCPGNVSNTVSFPLIRTENPVLGDLLINEVLFNPFPFGTDFVEIYNTSDKFIDLESLSLATLVDDSIANKKALSPGFILKPTEYVTFTVKKNLLLQHYPKSMANRILEVNSLPNLNDDEGKLVLIDFDGKQIDRFDYDESIHSPLLSQKEGVSLEKINPRMPSNQKDNWTSASKEVGYATPGYQNSQYLALNHLEESISITPQVITPNGDGDRDFLMIQIQTDRVAKMNSVIIFDALGREVKRLVKNQLSGTHAYIQWDGTNESDELVPLGHYLIWIELISVDGSVAHAKKKAVVADKF